MTRLSLFVPLLFLTVGVASCDTAARPYSGDGATGIFDAGAPPDSSIADMAATDDAGPVADAAPAVDIESLADAAPTADLSNMAETGVVPDAIGEPSYAACSFGSGIGRTLIAERDPVRDLCVVLVISRPAFGQPSVDSSGLVVLPPGMGVEYAFATTTTGSDCRLTAPPAGAVSAITATGVVTMTNRLVDVDATLTFPAIDGGPNSERIVATALDSSPACPGWPGPPVADGGAGGDDGAAVSTLTIDFTDPGAHVFAAQWLVFQPDESGTVNVQTEIASSWSTHPRAVEAQSLSSCGAALNEAESIRNLEAAGFPESANPPLSNMRSVQISEVDPIAFCTGVHHASGTWTFIHDPVLPTLDAASGLAIGTMTMSEDDVDLVAVLFDGDSVVRTLQYQTSP